MNFVYIIILFLIFNGLTHLCTMCELGERGEDDPPFFSVLSISLGMLALIIGGTLKTVGWN